ncbi:MAG: glycosyltransferase family 39 protein [Acidobacteria bacterium]|jgi:4-amino-4-deoxy-L-arabinose transferase-like glycosyltransferase|nr:glycosyltransferase family 39 protein [Acidobacteriota bacterium]
MAARAEEISTSHPASSGRALSIWWIVLIALLLRLAVITIGHTYRITPRRDHFQYGWEMGRIARSIALGQGFSSPTDLPTGPSAWAPPVYPYILAGVFRIFGIYSHASAWVILAFNSLFSALTSLLLYRIAQKLYGEGAARAVAWTWAVFPYAVYWPVRVVWETSLSAFLLTLALLLTLRFEELRENIPLLRWISFGLLWGVIALTNTALLIFFPICLLWLLYRLPAKTRQISRMALCVFTSVLVMTPWLVRNYQVFGKFVFIRDNLPLELYMANNDLSTGMWTRTEHPGNDPEAMRRFQELGEIGFMQEKKQQLETFLREHPERFVRFTLERALYFWVGTPQLTLVGSYNFLYFRHMTFFLGSAFALAGLWLSLRRRIRGVFLLGCLLLVYPLPYYLVNPFPRYKHPIEPVMLLLIVYLFYAGRHIPVRWPGTAR